MKNKPNDIPYLGVNEEKIRSVPVSSMKVDQSKLDRYVQWIESRYLVHLNKDFYKKDDFYEGLDGKTREIFEKKKFCNVRREQDRCSRWLIDNIINQDASFEDRFYRALMFRIVNFIPTAETFDMKNAPITDEEAFSEYLDWFKKKSSELGRQKYFTGAYTNRFCAFTAKFRSQPGHEDLGMIDCVPVYVRERYESDLFGKVTSAKTARDVFDVYNSFEGIRGNFMGYQYMIDYTYFPESQVSENEFVLAGPGCKSGIDKLFNGNPMPLKYEEFIFWLRDNFEEFTGIDPEKLFIDLPESERKVNVMLLENSFCEFLKYDKIWEGIGVTKNYIPFEGDRCSR